MSLTALQRIPPRRYRLDDCHGHRSQFGLDLNHHNQSVTFVGPDRTVYCHWCSSKRQHGGFDGFRDLDVLEHDCGDH